LSFAELSGAPAVWLAESVHPRFSHRLLDDCHKRGYAHRIAQEVVTYDEMVGVVGTGVGVGLVRESMARPVQAKGVVFRELPEPGLFVDVGAIYRTDNRSKSLVALLEVLGEMVDEAERELKRGKS
jgi:DNA-binding transcriptional LysR family regulator